MHKKNSYMDTKNILSDGIFDKLKKMLLGDIKVKKLIGSMNKDVTNLEKILNKKRKTIGIKSIKLQRFKPEDFISKG